MFSVVILTYNSELSIRNTLESARLVSDDVHVVDSYSSDNSPAISLAFGASVIQHPFENYGAQRNWAIDNLPLRYNWQLHLDADEYLSAGLIVELIDLKDDLGRNGVDGYYVPRMIRFLGRNLRFGGLYPTWHMRLFRTGAGYCEKRRYDQHFMVQGRTGKLHYPIVDHHHMTLSEWTARHNRWADAECDDLLCPVAEGVIVGKLTGSAVQKKRALRNYYYRFPLFVRPGLLFIYRYFLRFGFLDGFPGLIYIVLQAFWYRFLVDAKLYELQRVGAKSKQTSAASSPLRDPSVISALAGMAKKPPAAFKQTASSGASKKLS